MSLRRIGLSLDSFFETSRRTPIFRWLTPTARRNAFDVNRHTFSLFLVSCAGPVEKSGLKAEILPFPRNIFSLCIDEFLEYDTIMLRTGFRSRQVRICRMNRFVKTDLKTAACYNPLHKEQQNGRNENSKVREMRI